LAHSLITAGEEEIKVKGFNVIQLVDALNKRAKEVITLLDKQAEPVDSISKIKEVATLASKDSDVGELISTVMDRVGKDGVVTVEDSNTIGNSYEIVEGMKLDRGYISPYFVTDQETMEAVLNEPYILVTDKSVSAISEIMEVLKAVVSSGKKDILIVAEDVAGEALATLIVNKLRGICNAVPVRAPGFGDRKKETLQDIALVTGGSFISEDIGKKLQGTQLADLGSAHRVIVTKDDTVIVGGKGDKTAIDAKVSQLAAQLKKTESDYDKQRLKERAGRLSGGVAVIKVGAAAESAQKELRQRVDDAVSATRAAMEEGIVPGGGIALFNIREQFRNEEASGNSVTDAANRIIEKALESPLRAIVENSGDDSENWVLKLRANKDRQPWEGYNAVVGAIENLKEKGIVDPLKVTKTAFLNALSVASNYLVIGAAITIIPEKKDEQNKTMQI
jgi:chaperonin GroEL